jgi:peptidoglycan/LPS O-acetylase OafA/YrhL
VAETLDPPALQARAPNLAPPPGNPRFPLVDALRALAALCVFVGHTISQTTTLTAQTHLFVFAAVLSRQGVAIFFLISGFLLYRPFVVARRTGRPLSVRDYARRRVVRIVPAYWLALSVFLALGLVSGITAGNAWVFYGFGQIYSAATQGGGLSVAWSLCTEVSFYLVLPLYAMLMNRWGRRTGVEVAVLVALGVESVLFRVHFNGVNQYGIASTLPGMALWFALGMGAALASVPSAGAAAGAPARLERLAGAGAGGLWSAGAGLFALLYLASTGHPRLGPTANSVVTHVAYGAVALLILLPVVFGEHRGGWPRWLLRRRALTWLGLVSYGFYLYHPVLIARIDRLHRTLGVPWRYPFLLVVSLGAASACAAISYYALERPLMRRARGRRAVSPPAEAATAPR